MKEANHYYKIGADKGILEMRIMYGCNLINGDGIQQNTKEGIKYIKYAADSGDFEAIKIYSQVLLNMNDIIKIDQRELEKCLQFLCNKEDLFSMYIYGNFLLKNNKKEKASEFFKKSADKGFELSMYQYGLNLYYGIGVPVNKVQAAFYLKKAAEKGIIYAMYKYGQLFKDKIDEVVDYLKNEIDNENTFAMYIYGIMLYKGEGVLMNKKQAIHYFKISAEKGNLYSMTKILLKYKIIQIDIFKLLEYLSTTINKGQEFYNLNLNFVIPYGNDMRDLMKNKIQLLEMGVAQGDLKSMKKYAKKLCVGKFGFVDKRKAAELYLMAAEKGDFDSMKNYVHMILNESYDCFLYDIQRSNINFQLFDAFSPHLI